MTTVTISMPESMREFVDRQVSSGDFGTVSEYFRALVREAQARERDARLEALLLEGLDSGPELAVTPEFWTDLRVEAARLLNQRSKP